MVDNNNFFIFNLLNKFSLCYNKLIVTINTFLVVFSNLVKPKNERSEIQVFRILNFFTKLFFK